MSPEPLCYFGCPGRLNRTLLDLPNHPAPRLCEQHSQDWGIYRAALIAQSNTLDWPADFYPFERKMREQMEKEAQAAMTAESRASGTEIVASEAVIGFWYEVPSGEIERCAGVRNRGRGVQVGFVGIMETTSDPEEIRWLPGKTSVIVADEISVSKLVRALREDGKTKRGPNDLAWESHPRNGLLCSICEFPQRETASGATCAIGEHGGAPGRSALEVANRLGYDGHPEEAEAVLASVPPLRIVLDIETSPSLTTSGRFSAEQSRVEAERGAVANLQAQADALAEQGYVEEARVLLGIPRNSISPGPFREDIEESLARSAEQQSVPESTRVEPETAVFGFGAGLTFGAPVFDDPDLQAGGHGMTLREIAESYPQTSDLAGLAAREAGAIAHPAKLAGPSSIFHKSLHIDWRTPKALFDSQVRRWGPFWLDAAATAENKLAEYHLGPGAEVEDALSVDWLPTPEIVESCGENVWLNHPYSKRESVCAPDCAKPKCGERGYHLERPIASSGDWMTYARDQVLLKGARRVVCLTKAAVETGWWRDAVRIQPEAAGEFLNDLSFCDPRGGPASQFMDPQYPAATWFEFTWENLIVDVVEIEGRVDFDRGGDDGSAGFPSAIVTFSRRD
jgi:hypothetical protein